MGKTTSASILAQRGIPVVDTDVIARELVEPGEPALAEIQSAFGNAVIDADGHLCRAELARIVFSDSTQRNVLERILHPRIRQAWLKQIEAWRGLQKPLAMVVIPLLFETAAEKEFDAIICAACSEVTQKQRLQKRGWSPKHIQQRLAAQWPVEQKIVRSDFVVWTEGALASDALQLDRILAEMN